MASLPWACPWRLWLRRREVSSAGRMSPVGRAPTRASRRFSAPRSDAGFSWGRVSTLSLPPLWEKQGWAPSCRGAGWGLGPAALPRRLPPRRRRQAPRSHPRWRHGGRAGGRTAGQAVSPQGPARGPPRPRSLPPPPPPGRPSPSGGSRRRLCRMSR